MVAAVLALGGAFVATCPASEPDLPVPPRRALAAIHWACPRGVTDGRAVGTVGCGLEPTAWPVVAVPRERTRSGGPARHVAGIRCRAPNANPDTGLHGDLLCLDLGQPPPPVVVGLGLEKGVVDGSGVMFSVEGFFRLPKTPST